jgi:hypothetical protein
MYIHVYIHVYVHTVLQLFWGRGAVSSLLRQAGAVCPLRPSRPSVPLGTISFGQDQHSNSRPASFGLAGGSWAQTSGAGLVGCD